MQNKKRVIIFGTGSGYGKREKQLKEKYEIAAYTDNSGCRSGLYEPFIFPHEILGWTFDYIIVCNIKYYETIKYQLFSNFGIEKNKIICIDQVAGIREEKDGAAESIVFASVEEYKRLNMDKRFEINAQEMWLICNDLEDSAGRPLEHYFAQDIWAARKIHRQAPKEHFDIGSRLDGFIAHLLTFMEEVNYIDIRPLPYDICGLKFIQGDATNLENIESNSMVSLSSLHAVEHFGLGRYGDKVEPDACFKAMNALARVLKPGGRLYFGVPVGCEDKVIFNAHRIFSPVTIAKQFSEMGLTLLEYSMVRRDGYHAVVQKLPITAQSSSQMEEYSCGLFEFTK